MGYWNADISGSSFADDEQRPWMIWGDRPADAVGTASNAIIDAFAADLGRLPTKAEYLAGLLFGFPTYLPDEPGEVQEFALMNEDGYLKESVNHDSQYEEARAAAKALRESAESQRSEAFPHSNARSWESIRALLIDSAASLNRIED